MHPQVIQIYSDVHDALQELLKKQFTIDGLRELTKNENFRDDYREIAKSLTDLIVCY